MLRLDARHCDERHCRLDHRIHDTKESSESENYDERPGDIKSSTVGALL